jgi:DNA-damage-inducible protein J
MANASITIRMDRDLKDRAEGIFQSMGMNLTTAFTIFAKTVVREGKLPFEIAANPFWSVENQKRLKKAMSDIETGRNCAIHELIEDAHDENLAR